MLDVVIALLPAVLCSFVFYGWREILVMAVSVGSCLLLEWAITRYMLKKPSTLCDLSAVVTGILLGLNLPYTTPWWVVFIGAVVAIGVAKMTFGGLGQNIWNPALVGRVFLLVSFPTYMTTWSAPQGLFGADAVTGATPLGVINEGLMGGASVKDLMAQHGYDYGQMLFANLGGSAGEVCAIALLLGFVYLCVRRVIKPWITHRRSHPRRLLHGHRLCDLPDEPLGRRDLRGRHRFPHDDDPLLRLLSGGRFLRHPHHELVRSADQQGVPPEKVREEIRWQRNRISRTW